MQSQTDLESPHLLSGTTLMDRTEVLSPFLPGTNIMYAWDSTCLGLFKTCPRLYQYVIIDGWGSNEESIHLRFGIEYHQALQEYDISRASGIPHDDAVFDTVKALHARVWDWEVDEDSKAGHYKNKRSLVRTVCDYLDHFKKDPATTYILEDGRPAVELSFRFELDWGPRLQPQKVIVQEIGFQRGLGRVEEDINVENPTIQPYLLSGHLDRVVDYQGALYVMDRKTTTTTPGAYYFNQFEPNNQMSLYTIAGKLVLDSPVKGVIIDAAQILIDSSRFVRGFTMRTPDQLEEWTDDLAYHLSIAESYATEGYWPMNDTACDKFGGCRFREICSKSPNVREQFLKGRFTKQAPEDRWNPLKPR